MPITSVLFIFLEIVSHSKVSCLEEHLVVNVCAQARLSTSVFQPNNQAVF